MVKTSAQCPIDGGVEHGQQLEGVRVPGADARREAAVRCEPSQVDGDLARVGRRVRDHGGGDIAQGDGARTVELENREQRGRIEARREVAPPIGEQRVENAMDEKGDGNGPGRLGQGSVWGSAASELLG